MSLMNCNCQCRSRTAALFTSLLIGVIAAFLQITAVIAIADMFLWAVLIIAVAYLAVLIRASAHTREAQACDCLCANLWVVLAGILGAILFAVVLLLIDVAATSVIGAILVGLLFFFFTLLLTGSAALVSCFLNCEN